MSTETKQPPSRLFLSVREVAELLGVSHETVYRLLARGQLQSSNAFGQRMILKASLDELAVDTV